MKALIISHNCFSTTQSMGKTFASLFSAFKQDELMQLYLYPTIPNTGMCKELFRITDDDVIHSVFDRKSKCGRIIRPEEIKEDNGLYESEETNETYRKTKGEAVFARRARDFVWKLSNWKTKELKEWLIKGKPDVVFYALGDATFSQNIAMWVADFLNVPLITYVCDEFYYYYKKHPKLSSRLLCKGLVKNIKKTIIHSKSLITICDDLGNAYEKSFGIPYTTIMTGSSFEVGKLNVVENSTQISYIGNLELNRWKSVMDIKNALDTINGECGTTYSLTYYGTENAHLVGKVQYGGRLNPAQIVEVMEKSCLLIHVESFDPEYQPRLKYSVSTKIADSLASGCCLFAYAPGELASMNHLIKNECAFVAENIENLLPILKDALLDIETRKKTVSKALSVARKYHDSQINSNALKSCIHGEIS